MDAINACFDVVGNCKRTDKGDPMEVIAAMK